MNIVHLITGNKAPKKKTTLMTFQSYESIVSALTSGEKISAIYRVKDNGKTFHDVVIGHSAHRVAKATAEKLVADGYFSAITDKE